MALFGRPKPRPLLMDTYFSRPGKSVACATDLLSEVRDMLHELAREPCINQYIREKTPNKDDLLPPAPTPTPDTGSRQCQAIIAEFAVLEELDWALQSIAQGDASEIVEAYRDRHDKGRPAWLSEWGVEEALG